LLLRIASRSLSTSYYLTQIGPWLAGLVGIIAGLFMRQQAKATKAQAAQEVAEKKQEVAERTAAAA